jgi:hypothetical protein
VRQFDVGDFVYLQRQPNDTLDTSSDRTILKIKAIKPSGVLELQGANGRIIRDHIYSKYTLFDVTIISRPFMLIIILEYTYNMVVHINSKYTFINPNALNYIL